MKEDFAWPRPLVITVTFDWQVLSPTLHVLRKCLSAFIFRSPRSSLDVHELADPRFLSHHPTSLSACPARHNKPSTVCLLQKPSAHPRSQQFAHPQPRLYTSMQGHTHTLADSYMSGEPMTISVAQQEQVVWIYSGWCSVLTFSDNGWEIMEKADIQTGNIAAAAWSLSWSRT